MFKNPPKYVPLRWLPDSVPRSPDGLIRVDGPVGKAVLVCVVIVGMVVFVALAYSFFWLMREIGWLLQ